MLFNSGLPSIPIADIMTTSKEDDSHSDFGYGTMSTVSEKDSQSNEVCN